MTSTARIWIFAASILIAFVGVITLLWLFHSPYPCRALPFAYDYLCFAKNIDYIYKTQGSLPAFTYLNSIHDDLNYGASHLIAHQMGHALWEDTQDLHTALNEIPYKDYSRTEIFRYGGAVHGIFHSYFLFGSETEDVHALIRHSCAFLQKEQGKLLAGDCAHGVGHGLMAYTNNDVRQAMLLCEESIQPESCSKGIFMERGMLYIPGYADTETLEDISIVCDSLGGKERTVCAQYVGWTAIVKDLIETRTSNTTKALRVCEAYVDADRDGCITVAARDLFSIVYDNNIDAMAEACNALQEDAAACLQGLAEWEQWDLMYRGESEG